jgi:FkbM family methyltransferase
VKYFIDGGGHKGESVRLFRNTQPEASSFKVISFESNPTLASCFAADDLQDVEFHAEALWIEDGTVSFYTHPRDYGWAIHPENWGMDAVSVTVPCIDLSTWMLGRFSKDDHIVLKLDIEGSEYEVLTKMIHDGSIGLVHKLFIEWHAVEIRGGVPSPYCRTTITKEAHDALLAELARIGLPWEDWNAL